MGEFSTGVLGRQGSLALRVRLGRVSMRKRWGNAGGVLAVSTIIRTIAVLLALGGSAFGASLVMRSADGGFAVADRNDLILICRVPDLQPGGDTVGQAGGFVQVLHDLSRYPILGDREGAPGISWKWFVSTDSAPETELVPAFERWIGSDVNDEYAEGLVQNAWVRAGDGAAVFLETVGIRVYSKIPQIRVIDLDIRLLNVAPGVVTLGAGEGAAGLTVAPGPHLQRLTYAAFEAEGALPGGRYRTPWLTMVYPDERRATVSSLSVLQAVDNAGTDSRNGRIGADGTMSFGIGTDTTLVPGEKLDFRYRIYIDSREYLPARLEDAYFAFESASKILPE